MSGTTVLAHGDDCECTRCRGFKPGNTVAIERATHGAYADLKLGARVAELAADLAPLVPAYRASDQVTVQLLALSIARIEAAALALEQAKPGELARLEQDLRGWVGKATTLADKLGMTPTARARLGVDVAVARRQATLTAMAADAARGKEVES